MSTYCLFCPVNRLKSLKNLTDSRDMYDKTINRICHFINLMNLFEVFDGKQTGLTLLALPPDMISEMPLAASFFSATQRTRLICPRFRIISASCCVSGHRALCAAQKYLHCPPSRCRPDRSKDGLPRRCTISMPGDSHSKQPVLQCCDLSTVLAC